MRNEAPSRSLVRRANQVKTLALLLGAVGVFVTALGILGAALPLVYETDPVLRTVRLWLQPGAGGWRRPAGDRNRAGDSRLHLENR